MIGRIRGQLALKNVETIIVEAAGVGYEIHCPLTVLDRLPPEGEECTLSIHTHVREDQLTLFGFNDFEERALFRLLITVSGVGPRLAVACLSGLSADDLTGAILDENVKRLTGVPGIGKRTAERMILDLKEKLRKRTPSGRPAASPGAAPRLDDLESALRNLGYRPKDVESLIADLAKEAGNMTFEELLRESLKRL
ncbi:MAG: Holliday junction branch migration protein RuvA [Bradymonadia bacterium]